MIFKTEIDYNQHKVCAFGQFNQNIFIIRIRQRFTQMNVFSFKKQFKLKKYA